MISFSGLTLSPADIRATGFASTSVGQKPPEEPPLRYKEVISGFLATGGGIEKDSEFEFIVNRGYKSILSVLDEELLSERIFVGIYNDQNQDNPIRLCNINMYEPCGLLPEVDSIIEKDSLSKPFSNNQENNKKLTEFINLVNELPKPIYMHCVAGKQTSPKMARFIQMAMKSDLIKRDNPMSTRPGRPGSPPCPSTRYR